MAKGKSIEQKFTVKCPHSGTPPIEATVLIYQRNGDEVHISSDVSCVYVGGGHGERCNISRRYCPYAFDIPIR